MTGNDQEGILTNFLRKICRIQNKSLQVPLPNSGSFMCVEVRMYVVKVAFKKSNVLLRDNDPFGETGGRAIPSEPT